MKFDEVRAVVADTPYLGLDEAEEIYQFVCRWRPDCCLELGHAHGASSLYIAAALHENGAGHLDTVDLETSFNREPNIETLLDRAELSDIVSVYREKNSYTWYLRKLIEAQSSAGMCTPLYDFCFIDGPKNWTIDGLAFFLVDKLLRDKGWILFDDYGWTHSKHKYREQTDGITTRSLSEQEIAEPHVASIFRLLVMQHPEFSNFELQDGWWAWAQKTPDGNRHLRKTKKLAANTIQ